MIGAPKILMGQMLNAFIGVMLEGLDLTCLGAIYRIWGISPQAYLPYSPCTHSLKSVLISVVRSLLFYLFTYIYSFTRLFREAVPRDSHSHYKWKCTQRLRWTSLCRTVRVMLSVCIVFCRHAAIACRRCRLQNLNSPQNDRYLCLNLCGFDTFVYLNCLYLRFELN